MEALGRKRDRARIEARTRDTQARRIHYASRPEHGAVVMYRSRLAGILHRAWNWIRGLFGRGGLTGIPVRCSRSYHYDGPLHAAGTNGDRFGVYMRQRGRKYKTACA